MGMRKMFASIAKSRWLKVATALALSCILVLSVARLHPVRQAERGATLDTFTAHIDERIPELMETYQIPGVTMALVQNSKVVWSQAFGYADLESGRKMRTDTVCRVQSISKPVTAWGVMKLVEQGEIDLDNPVTYYLEDWKLPESEFSEEKTTVRRLLSHKIGRAHV